MEKNKIGVIEAIQKSKTIKAAFITFLVIILAILAWTNYNMDRMFKQFVRQGDSLAFIAGQTANVEKLKTCVNDEYNEAMEEFGKMLNIIGKTLENNNVTFPQPLNESIEEFRKEFGEVKECLIFPEKQK